MGYDAQLYDPLNSSPDEAIYSGPAAQLNAITYAFDQVSLDQDHPIVLFKTTPWFGRLASADTSEKAISPISQKEENVQAHIWPNPTTGKVNIWVQDTIMVHVTVVVSDLNGRVLLATKPTSELSSVNISDLSSGTYLIKVLSGNGVWVKRIVRK